MKLKEEEVICSRCNGNGWIEEDRLSTISKKLYLPCSKCGGFGRLDWISNVVGRKSTWLIWRQESFQAYNDSREKHET
jgi:hypothetical protein